MLLLSEKESSNSFAYFFCSTKVLIFILLVIINTSILSQDKNNVSSKKDSTLLKDVQKIDTLVNKREKQLSVKDIPILSDDFLEYKIEKNKIENVDYLIFSDVFNNHSFIYDKNLSSFGTPNQLTLYGQTSNKISFLQDGIEINNRFNSNIDINNLLSENVSQIEIIPISRSFLFGTTNISSINFCTFEPKTNKPFSRLKFFQGSDEEGFIDGMINLFPYKNLITFFEISNQSYDGRYSNSSFSNWKGVFRVKYIYSEKLNFTFSYFHLNNSIQLNGGIDADSIRQITDEQNFDNIAFNNVLAPIRFYNKYLTTENDKIILRTLAKLSDNNLTKISFFYQNEKNFFRQNVIGNLQTNVFPIKRENYSLSKGFNLISNFSFGDLDLFIYSNFERNQLNSQVFNKQNLLSFFNLSTGVTYKIFNFAKQSIFAKFLTQAQSTYLGVGTDFNITITTPIKLYFGFSSYKNPMNFIERRFALNKNWNDESNIKTFESKIFYTSANMILNIGYFYLMNDNFLLPALISNNYKNDDIYFVKSINSKNSGLSSYIKFNYWKLTFENSSSFYFNNEERVYRGLPEFENKASLFYSDILFKNNLNLITGFNFYIIGNRFEQRFDFEKGISSSYFIFLNDNSIKQISDKKFSSSFKLDFFLIGTIQESAKVYVTWENLLDSKFYFVPYYPAYPRNLRIGVSWNFID